MERLFYKEYFLLERTHWWFKARLKILESLFCRKIFLGEPLKILNAGAATGATSQMLKKYGNVVSLEYDKDCSIFLSEILNEKVVNGSLTKLPFHDHSFDVVCAFDVIEHIENDLLALKEIYRVLKPGGYTFISVPTFDFLWSKHDRINQHIRRYSLPNLIKLMCNAGFKDHSFKSYFNFFLFLPIAITRTLSNLTVGLNTNKGKGSGSDFERNNLKSVTSKILYCIFCSEKNLLRIGLKFPFGVSAMIISKKPID